MTRSLARLAPDVALAWALTATILFGGMTIVSRWFEGARSAMTTSAEIAAQEIAANEGILRTRPTLVGRMRTLEMLLAQVDLDGDTPNTVARFVRGLDRAAHEHGVRLISITSSTPAHGLSVAARPQPAGTTGPSANSADPFDAIPFDVVVEGRFTSVIGLVRSLATERALVDLEIRSIVRASGESSNVPRLMTAFAATVYRRQSNFSTHPAEGRTHDTP